MSYNNSQNQEQCQLDDQMYQVQQIRGKKKIGKKTLYHVKWLNWDRPEDMTWEPIQNLNTVLDLVEKFQKDLKEKQKNNKDDINKPTIVTINKKQKIKQKKLQKENSKKLRHRHSSSSSSSSQSSKQKQKQKSPPKKQNSKKNQQKQISSSITKKKSKFQKIKQKQKQKQIEISDDDQLRVSSSQIQQKESNSESQQQNSSGKLQRKTIPVRLTIGAINCMLVKQNGDILYDVDMVNNDGNCIGVKLVSSSQLKKQHEDLLIAYLEDYMIDEERLRTMK